MELNMNGMTELLNNLARLPIEEEVEKNALNKATNVVKKAIAEEAPIDSKNPVDGASLHKNIKSTRYKDGVVSIHTGGAYHAHLVEFGRSAGSKYALKNGKRQLVTWGATNANPFFTRGFGKSSREAVEVMGDEIKKALRL